MSLHGEMPLNFNNTEKTPETISSLREALFGKLIQHEWEGNGYNQQEVNGELTGGNLSLLCSLIGTEAEPVTKKKILFLEDVGEYYYHIDRMLTSLKLSGKLEDLSALIIGGMNKMEDIKIPWGKSIEETIVNIAGDYGYPVLFNFPAGHISDNRSIYIGKRVQIKSEGNRNTLIFI
jgi:muramoyltetrapeptide carboxypeptidase